MAPSPARRRGLCLRQGANVVQHPYHCAELTTIPEGCRLYAEGVCVAVNSLAIASIVLGGSFAAALVGMILHIKLPDRHLDPDSRARNGADRHNVRAGAKSADRISFQLL